MRPPVTDLEVKLGVLLFAGARELVAVAMANGLSRREVLALLDDMLRVALERLEKRLRRRVRLPTSHDRTSYIVMDQAGRRSFLEYLKDELE